MKSYRAPGIYSQFLPAQPQAETGSVNRRIAIVGPGQKFFSKENVAVKRSSTGVLDSLPNKNIIEITGVYNCKYTNGKFEYTDGAPYTTYKLSDDKILWIPVDEDGIPAESKNYLRPARVEKVPDSTRFTKKDEYGKEIYTGSYLLTQDRYLSLDIDRNLDGTPKVELLKDATYILEITNTEKAGTYTIYNETTGELLGEYILDFGDKYRTDIIPGIKIKLAGSGIQDDESGEFLFPKGFSVGDSIRIKVYAPNNFIDSSAMVNTNPVDRMSNGSVAWFKKGSDLPYLKTSIIVPEGSNPNNVNRRLANIKDFAVVKNVTAEAQTNVVKNNLASKFVINGVEDNFNRFDIKIDNNRKTVLDEEYRLIITKYDKFDGNKYVIQGIDIINSNDISEELPLPGFSILYGDGTNFPETVVESLDDILHQIDKILYDEEVVKDLKSIRDLDNSLFPILDVKAFKNNINVIKNDIIKNYVEKAIVQNAMKDELLAAAYNAIVNNTSFCNEVENLDINVPLLTINTQKTQTLVSNVIITKDSKLTNYDYILKGIGEKEVQLYRVISNGEIGTIQSSDLQIFGMPITVEEEETVSVTQIPGVRFDITRPKGVNFEELTSDGELFEGTMASNYTDIISVISVRPRVYAYMQPKDDEVYYVSYKYAKEDFSPKLFTDFDDIKNEYGTYSIALTGQVANAVTLAAEIAFNNGAREIVISQTENQTKQAFKDAIDRLGDIYDGIENVNVIVPLSSDWEVVKHLSNHVTLYSGDNYNLYRMGYVAAATTEPTDSDDNDYNGNELGSIQKSKLLNNERMVYVTPGYINKSVINSITGYSSTRVLPGYFAAVAVASLALRNDVAEPLTNKQIYGINSLGKLYKENEANKLANAGCLVLKQEKGIIKVRHGITTHYEFQTFNDINSNEITLVQIKDHVIERCRYELGQNYVGNKLKPSVVSDITYTMVQLLTAMVTSEIIIGYDGLTVKRDTENPMQVNIQFYIEAVYPLNFIEIKFGFSTTISE